MKITLTAHSADKSTKSALVIGVFDNKEFTPAGKQLDKAVHGALSKLVKNGAASTKLGACLPVFELANGQYPLVILVGAGKTKELSPTGFKQIIKAATRCLFSLNITDAISYLTELDVDKHTLDWKIKLHTEISLDCTYRFDVYKSNKEPNITLKKLELATDTKATKTHQQALEQGQAIANGMRFTKDLANQPSNVCTPTYLVHAAKKLSKEYPSIKVKVLDEKAMEKLGMGSLLGVTKGTEEPAHLICLEYLKGKKSDAPIAFVGKGITFDTGGNSLKTPENMVGMKYDMCGAATVLGTLKAAAELNLPLNIVGVIPAVENMPGGNAYKPEDILTSLSGQTIEVISTDAEGRLILCDALTYCERTYKPASVIDIATLTGAVLVALGTHATGLMSNDETLTKALLKAGNESNDRAWQLPLWDEYQEQINSPFADIANSGGRFAGTITAGCFLSRFTKKMKWAHLDVAGTAAMMMGTSERMATGRPVPMLVQYLLDQVK